MAATAGAAVLLAQGRHRTGPIVEAYLARLAEAGVLGIDDPAEAFQLLYGLVVRDLQIRVLLGEPPPPPRPWPPRPGRRWNGSRPSPRRPEPVSGQVRRGRRLCGNSVPGGTR